MKIQLKSEFSLSNNSFLYSDYDDLMLRGIYTQIMLDISETLTEEEYYEKEAMDDDMLTEIGEIICYRFDLKYSQNDLYYVADNYNEDLHQIARFFFYQEGKELLEEEIIANTIYYINDVFIKPEYRGKNYGLYAVALLLESIASEQLVSCHPAPMRDYKDKYSEEKGKILLRKYWSKLGLDRYEKKHNILWSSEWEMPKWIRKKLFPDFEDNEDSIIEKILSDVNSDKDNLVKQEDNVTMTEEEKDNLLFAFWEYLRCIENYAPERYSKTLYSYLTHYYSYSELLLKQFDINEISELVKPLLNKKGEPMFTQQEIETFHDAIKFAFSNDPKKVVNYLCTIEYHFPKKNSNEEVKITCTLKVKCISNEYLKLSEDNGEYYQYINDIVEKLLYEHYLDPNLLDPENYWHFQDLDYKLLDE